MGGFRDIGDAECCFCLPMKHGVALIAAGTLAYSFIYMVCLLGGDVRFQSGGYEPYTAKLQALVGCAGVAAGLMGVQGALDSKVSYLKVLSNYQAVKVAVMLLVFVFDMRLLLKCETWESPASEINHAMDNIASQGLCDTARISYVLGFLMDFAISVYFLWVCSDYARRIETNPSYVIKFDDDFRFNHSQVKYYDPSIGEPGQYLSGQSA
eukprot:gb/GFBE01079819.1/.p1 GENE.gb/GFBE01079819.1/~~gb/GFBE01079819.1/.p1  ORF type:complete len:210 (+),score=49.55 gb/GFBE01079819.1/:1-630(+)